MPQLGTKAHAYFDASHTIKDDPQCGTDHGHTYEVIAHVTGDVEIDIFGIVRIQGAENLREQVETIAGELDHRNLEAMMPGVQTTPEGVANWILERIPTADTVTVRMGWRNQEGLAFRDKKR
jgi:6-pyruvoyl-tetrahydropterin synthase